MTAEKNASPLGMFIYRIISGAFYRLGGLQLLKRKYKGDISERIGNVENIPENPVWVHAVSVGEVQSASSLIRRIKSRSAYPCIISTVTPTGRSMAEKLLSGVADRIIYSPFDSRRFVSRSLDAIRPAIYITMETELWPEILTQLRARNVPAFLANGRLSDKSFNRMRRTKFFWRGILDCLNKLMVRFDDDREKFHALGVPDEKIIVTGDCKVDALLDRRKATSPDKWSWLKNGKSPLFTAGSTHPGEEEIVISAFRIVRRTFPGARLAIVPRHPERALMTIAAALPYDDVHAELLSKIEQGNNTADIIVVDRIGVLFDLYAASDAVFVGGSLVQKGGQNPFEPALFGLPAIHGPCMTDFPDTDRMDSMKAAFCVHNDSELAKIWLDCLEPENVKISLKNCNAYFKTLGGAAKKTWDEIKSYMLDRKAGEE
ncbi:MAG: 3-deoxy-D-manno-octulosonic acid transferase [Synergistaceae bacterium]|nr:3-deoxy-D-manno-octulosonic acid transferase [Synergistaceae bacterium]